MTTIEKLKIMLEAPASTSIVAYRTFLKDMLDESEKYRWHDLRKDPDDLPNYKNDVEVVMHDGTHCFMFLDFSIEKNERRWYSSYPYEGEDQSLFYIRAWREIEPFEER